MAEGVRFELTESQKTLNGFRGRRLKPLGHPSGKPDLLNRVVLNSLFEPDCQGSNICRISLVYAPSFAYMINGGPIVVPARAPFVPATKMSLASSCSRE